MSAPEESESKKRVLSEQDGDIDDAIRNKRAALGPTESNQQQQQFKQQRQSNYSFAAEKFYFKILCPQSITGIIIGKGGSTINQLNGSTGCSIKLSHNNEYYPGTNDRILLCHGTKEALQLAIDELVTKIAEAAEKKYPTEPRLEPYPPNRSADGSFLVRVLIPRNSEGALIGKGGLVVRQMTNDTGCNFQLGQENDNYGTNERIFTLTSATVHSIVNGAAAVLHNLINSPKIRSYLNTGTSYGNAPSNQMSAPLGMPYQQPQNGYMPAPMMAAPGMVMMPAPGYGMAPQYVQAMPPQMTVPGGGMVPMVMQAAPMGAPQQVYGQQPAYGQAQGHHQQGQGAYNYNQGRAGNPSRHAGGPNGRGAHGGQGQGHGQGNRHNKYGAAPGQQQQGQQQGQQGYAGQQQAAPVYQQQQAQAQAQPQVSAGQYPVQQQPPAQVQGQQQVQQQYLYPSTAIPGMPQQQQAAAPVYQQQPQGQVQGQHQQGQAKPAHQQQQQVYGVPQQQQQAYGQQQQVQQQPYHAAATAAPQQQQVPQQQGAPQGYVAAGSYPAYADPAQAQYGTVQPQVQVQGQAQGYPQQQQYVQYAVPGQTVAGAAPQQQQYGAYGAAARK